jgi:hypothetical protein
MADDIEKKPDERARFVLVVHADGRIEFDARRAMLVDMLRMPDMLRRAAMLIEHGEQRGGWLP